MLYASKIKKDPSKSYVFNQRQNDLATFNMTVKSAPLSSQDK
jgi:uncharacterized ion transporter superfamily protein YfcC